MARYSVFLGRKVEVQYRAGDILLPASGTLVADSGRSIFLQQTLVQRGQEKHFRWEIPYQYMVRIEEIPQPEVLPSTPVTSASAAPVSSEGANGELDAVVDGESRRHKPSTAKAASTSSNMSAVMLPLNPPKPA